VPRPLALDGETVEDLIDTFKLGADMKVLSAQSLAAAVRHFVEKDVKDAISE
jgi:hypothetical protein